MCSKSPLRGKQAFDNCHSFKPFELKSISRRRASGGFFGVCRDTAGSTEGVGVASGCMSNGEGIGRLTGSAAGGGVHGSVTCSWEVSLSDVGALGALSLQTGVER